MKASLSAKQANQEKQYSFPYHYLDLIVEEFKYIQFIEYLSILKLVQKKLQPYKGQRLLDVGCGDGRFLYELQDEDLQLTGADYSENAIRFAKAFAPDVNFVVADATKLGGPRHYDIITMIEVLEHIPPAEVSKVLKDLAQQLKASGQLIITVPSKRLTPLPKKHYQHFDAPGLYDLLSEYFDEVEIRGYDRNTGLHRWTYIFFKKLGVLLLPFRRFLPGLKTYYSWLRGYYQKHLLQADAHQCLGLIAVCRDPK